MTHQKCSGSVGLAGVRSLRSDKCPSGGVEKKGVKETNKNEKERLTCNDVKVTSCMGETTHTRVIFKLAGIGEVTQLPLFSKGCHSRCRTRSSRLISALQEDDGHETINAWSQKRPTAELILW